MELPKYFNLVRTLAQLCAVLGCITGVVGVFAGFGAFSYGFFAGIAAISMGVFTILASLAALGVAYCFLAIVEAQVDTRNAIIDYLASKQL